MRPSHRKPIVAALTALVLVLVTGCGQRAVRSQPTIIGQPMGTPTTAPATATPPAGYTETDPPPVVNNGPRTGDEVALTFDADMTPSMVTRMNNTPGVSYANVKVIQTLEQRQVPATFFITGLWAQQYPQLMARLAGNPDFDIANHTWTHRAVTANCYGLPQMQPAELTAEVARTFAEIRPYGGHQTNFFRFPGLCHNAAALTALVADHVTVVDGDVISGDPGATSAAPIISAVLHRVQPGSIVILHITEDNARFTDEALPAILDGLAQRGLHPVRLSVLLGMSG